MPDLIENDHLFEPGSAWSVWYYDGVAYARDHGGDVEQAARCYAGNLGSAAGESRYRAFKAGAQRELSSNPLQLTQHQQKGK